MRTIDALNQEILKEDIKLVEEEIKKEIRKRNKSCYVYIKNAANYTTICNELTEAGYSFTKNGEAINITLK